MSSFQVTERHLFAIVRQGIRVGAIARPDATEWMRKLAIANDRSVTHRYHGGEETPGAFDALRFDPVAFTVEDPSAVAMLKLIRSLAHQSSDHPDWSTSEACQILDSITTATIMSLPGYHEAPWSI